VRRVCAWCNKVLSEGANPNSPITHGICQRCSTELFKTMNTPAQEFLNSLAIPILVVDGTGLIISANVTMQDCFGKTVDPKRETSGGEIFECEHARGPEGCGGANQCEDCGIRRVIAETYRTGEGCVDFLTHLDLRGASGVRRIWLRITTEKVADKVLLKVMETLEPVATGSLVKEPSPTPPHLPNSMPA